MKKQVINLERIISNLQELIDLQRTEIKFLKDEHEESSSSEHVMFHQVDFLLTFITSKRMLDELHEFINENLLESKSESIERIVLEDLLKNIRGYNDKESNS